MKKCLLSILAGALLIVSCQNYDDQFDDLNSQITALASQVAGLSKVQSDLTALQGTVSSLQGNIASSVDTALASGLAGINAAVDNLQSQIDGIASSEEVAAIQSDVTAAQDDLTELLNNSNVYQGDLTISTPSQLSAALAFGTKLNIVNGNVYITHETTMDADSIQTVVNRINTVVKDFSYLSQSSSIKEVTFSTITGVASLTAKGVGYQFPNLESATNVFLHDEYKSKVRVIAFDKLTSVTSLNTRNGATDTAGTVAFNKATNLHLTALKRYPGASLTLRVDEGGTIKIDALDNVDALGKKTALALTIEGPSSVNYTKFTKGTITLKNVATATVDNNTTGFVLDEGVVSFTSNSVVTLNVSAASDLETLNITGVKNTAATPIGPAIAFASATDLTNLTLAGDIASVSATGCGNLTNVTISAAVVGAVNLSTNTDLTAVTLTGSSMTGLTFAGNTDMENLTVDTAWTDGTLSVTDNTSLISLTCSSDNLENLTVTGNDDMTTVNFTGVTKGGSTGSPSVAIYDNDLVASAVDTAEDPAVTDFGATDGGSFTSASGMDTLKTYLTAISADADTTAHVFWDNMESFTDEASAETTDKLFILADGVNAQTNAAYITILRQIPNTAAAGSGATKAKQAWVIDGVSSGNLTRLVNNSTELFAGGAGETYTANTGINMLALSGNQTLDLASILNTAHVTRATATEATLTASAGGNWSTTVTIETLSATLGASGTVTGERYTTSAARTAASSAVTIAGYNAANFMDSDDYVTLTVGSNSVTATGQGTDALADAIATAWQAKYGVAGTASSSSVATVTSGDTGVITIRGYDHSGGANTTVAMSVTGSGTVGTGNAAEGVEYKIGATRSAADMI
jgi:PBP1b-binding outer membrane lipoprotein LpoB